MSSVPQPGDAQKPETPAGTQAPTEALAADAPAAAAGAGAEPAADAALTRNPGAPPAIVRTGTPRKPPGSGTVRAAITRARQFARGKGGVDEMRYRVSIALLVITCLMALAISIAIAVTVNT